MPKTLRRYPLACLVALACAAYGSGSAAAQPRSLFSFAAPSGARPAGIARGRDGTLYGVTHDGGAFGKGAVVAVSHGVARALYSFRGQSDGVAPSQLVYADDGALYGLSTLPASVEETPQCALFRVSRSGRFTLLARSAGTPESLALVRGQDGGLYLSSAYQAAVLALDTRTGSLRAVQSFASGTWANTLLVTRSGALYGTTQSMSGPGHVFAAVSGSYSELASLPAGEDGTGIEQATALARGQDGTLYVATQGGASAALYAVQAGAGLARIAELDAPASALTLNGSELIGATRFGGSAQQGSLFRVANARLSPLVSFRGGREGAAPVALLAAGGVVYGSAADGGAGGMGSFFRYSATGGLSSLYSFTFPDGAGPTSLVLGSDGALYGVAQDGGPGGAGTVFRATKDGALTLLHGFSTQDGAAPQNVMEGRDGALYGRTLEGGSTGQGTLFKLDKSGALTTLLEFGEYGQSRGPALVQLADGTLYGADQEGNGHIFRVNGAGQREVVYSFAGLQTREGASPSGIVAAADGVIYGVTRGAYGPLIPPSYSSGTVFRLTPDGKLDTLYAFLDEDNQNGASPRGLLIGQDGALHGVTANLSFTCGTYGGLWRLPTDASGALELVHDFTGREDGTGPSNLLQATDGRFFGLTVGGVGPRDPAPDGDTSSCGVRTSTLFMQTAAGLSTLHDFGFAIGASINSVNVDQAGSLLDGKDGKLYGALANGGSSGSGELFVFEPPPLEAAPQ